MYFDFFPRFPDTFLSFSIDIRSAFILDSSRMKRYRRVAFNTGSCTTERNGVAWRGVAWRGARPPNPQVRRKHAHVARKCLWIDCDGTRPTTTADDDDDDGDKARRISTCCVYNSFPFTPPSPFAGVLLRPSSDPRSLSMMFFQVKDSWFTWR